MEVEVDVPQLSIDPNSIQAWLKSKLYEFQVADVIRVAVENVGTWLGVAQGGTSK